MTHIRTTALLVLVGVFGLAGFTRAGTNPDLNLFIGSAQLVGGSVDIDVTLDNDAEPVAGWSYGVCHTPAVDIVDVVNGTTTATVNNGAAPDFESTNVYPGEGWSTGVVASFIGAAQLQPGLGYQLNVASYEVLGVAGDSSPLTFCGADFPLPVDVVFSSQAGTTVFPTTNDGVIDIVPDTFYFSIDDREVFYSSVTGAATFDACVSIREDTFNANFPNETLAFSMGITFDDSLLTVTEATPAGVIADLAGGAGPDFFGINLMTSGATVGCVYAFAMNAPIEFAAAEETVCFGFETVASALAGDDVGTSTSIDFMAIGDPVVQNTVAVGLTEYPVLTESAAIDLVPGGLFIRGDANVDGAIDVSDPVYMLAFLFQMGPGDCIAAMDANDDDVVNIADPSYTLLFLFTMGDPIPPPYPDCGPDPTPNALECENPGFCQ